MDYNYNLGYITSLNNRKIIYFNIIHGEKIYNVYFLNFKICVFN